MVYRSCRGLLVTPPMPNGKTSSSCYRLKKLVGKQRGGKFADVLDAIFYRADNGIKWRALPCNFPATQTVWYSDCGSDLEPGANWGMVAQVRTAAGREAQPSLAIIDSQSVRWGKRGDEQALMATKRQERAQAPYCCRCHGISLVVMSVRQCCRYQSCFLRCWCGC